MCRRTVLGVRVIVGVCAIAFAAAAAYPQPTGYEGYQVVRITVADDSEVDTLRTLQTLGPDFQVWSEVIRIGPIDVRIAPAAKPALDASGLAYEITVADLQQHIDDLYRGPRDGGFFDSLATYEEHVQFMTDLAADYPELAEMVLIGTSVQGRSMWALRLTGPGEDKPGVMYHGAQHGNEQAAASLVAYVAHHLLTNYASDPEVAALVNNVEWFLLPIMNPDGYVRYSRYNTHWVDLNRNWGGPGSGQEPAGGPYPFSEPETAAMRDFFLAHPNVRVHNDVHGYVPWIMWPWGHTSELCPDHGTFHMLGSEVHDLIEAAGGGDYEIGAAWAVSYAVSGGSMSYSYGELGVWAFTFELAHSQVPLICEEFLSSMLFLGKWIGDCNDNGVPDVSEIATGTSDDRNTNGVPDECEKPSYCVAPESTGLRSSDGDAEDHFGLSVAFSGDTALIGASHDSDHFLEAGAAYVLRLHASGWIEEDKLTASDGAEGDLFGRAVAISKDVALVGAPGRDEHGDGSGAVYVFRFNGTVWVEEAKLTASDGNESDGFGVALAISGDSPQWALVGATGADGGDGGHGAAYVYRFGGSDWVEQAKLVAFGDPPGLMFGTAVGITGDSSARAIVGDLRNHANGYASGAAYTFRFDGSDWVEDARLTASDGAAHDTLGQSVALFGETALVGAPGADVYGHSSGSAYVFRFNGAGWIEEAKLAPFDGEEFDDFGCSVAVSGSSPPFALIGAAFDDDNGRNSGSAYVFRFNGETWSEAAKLTASDGTRDDHFGHAVAVSNNTALIGAPSNTYEVSDVGLAYVFRGPSTDCNDNLTADICEIASGTAGDCNRNDTLDECDIAAGTSRDRFPHAWGGDGVPDECQLSRPRTHSEKVQAAIPVLQTTTVQQHLRAIESVGAVKHR